MESSAAKFLYRASIPVEDRSSLVAEWTKHYKVLRETMATRRPYCTEVMFQLIEGSYDQSCNEDELKTVARDCLKTLTTEDIWLASPERMHRATQRLQQSNLPMSVKAELQKIV